MFDNSSAKKLRAFLLILDACQVLSLSLNPM